MKRREQRGAAWYEEPGPQESQVQADIRRWIGTQCQPGAHIPAAPYETRRRAEILACRKRRKPLYSAAYVGHVRQPRHITDFFEQDWPAVEAEIYRRNERFYRPTPRDFDYLLDAWLRQRQTA